MNFQLVISEPTTQISNVSSSEVRYFSPQSLDYLIGELVKYSEKHGQKRVFTNNDSNLETKLIRRSSIMDVYRPLAKKSMENMTKVYLNNQYSTLSLPNFAEDSPSPQKLGRMNSTSSAARVSAAVSMDVYECNNSNDSAMMDIPPTLLKKELVSRSYSGSSSYPRNSFTVNEFGDIYEFRGSNGKNSLKFGKIEAKLRGFEQFLSDDSHESAKLQNWKDFLSGKYDLINDVGKFGSKLSQHDYGIFKQLVCDGIPMSLRSQIWTVTSGAFALSSTFDTYDTVHSSDIACQKQIKLDSKRTMRNNIYYKEENGPGMTKLKNVLTKFANSYPEIGYCQGMNLVVGNILLIYASEKHGYVCFENLVQNILGPSFYKYPFDNVRHHVDTLCKELFPKYFPKLHEFLCETIAINFNFFIYNWYLTLFASVLPTDTLFKVWDLLFCIEGDTQLYKTTLAIFKFFEPVFYTEFNTSDEIYEFLINLKNKIISYNLTSEFIVEYSQALEL